MADAKKESSESPVDKQIEKQIDEKSIQRMGYKQIIEANRRQHKGTIMDRSWRFDPETNGEMVLANDDLTRWQKFTNGAYTYQAVTSRFISNFQIQMKKVEFVESIIEKKSEFQTEEDKLLIKRAELTLLRKYNWYRAPFNAGAATICLLSIANPKLSPARRIAPLCLAGPFIMFYQNNIGSYGVQRQIDDLLILLRG